MATEVILGAFASRGTEAALGSRQRGVPWQAVHRAVGAHGGGCKNEAGPAAAITEPLQGRASRLNSSELKEGDSDRKQWHGRRGKVVKAGLSCRLRAQVTGLPSDGSTRFRQSNREGPPSPSANSEVKVGRRLGLLRAAIKGHTFASHHFGQGQTASCLCGDRWGRALCWRRRTRSGLRHRRGSQCGLYRRAIPRDA